MEGDKDVDFLKLAPPTRDDLSRMLERMVNKTLAMDRRLGLLEEVLVRRWRACRPRLLRRRRMAKTWAPDFGPRTPGKP